MTAAGALSGAIRPLPGWLAVVFAALAGLVVGSFLNVVVYRMPRRLSVVRPGSFCPGCGTALRALDNVPLLSWVVLGGRCRTCREPISARYPLVEGSTGALFALVAVIAGPHWAVAGLCLLVATVLAAAVIELDGLAPTRSLALWGSAAGGALLVVAGVLDRHWVALLGAGAGVALSLAVLAAAGRAASRTEVAWVTVPTALALGWSGAAGAAAGAGALVVVLVAGNVRRRPRPSPEAGPAPPPASQPTRLAMASGVAVLVALAVAAATGVPVGR
ncbi:MAG: prepilin peptidase [Acidimicrobiales bacterium]